MDERRGTRRHHSSLTTHTTAARPVVIQHVVDRRMRDPVPRRSATPCGEADEPLFPRRPRARLYAALRTAVPSP